MKKLVFGPEGPQLVTDIATEEVAKFPELNEEECLKVYKKTIIVALQNRLKACTEGLEKAVKYGSRDAHHIQYEKDNGTYYVFKVVAQEAMQQAIKLAEEEKWDEFTALMWGQTIKGLVWVKRLTHKPYAFDHLFAVCLDRFSEKSVELTLKKD